MDKILEINGEYYGLDFSLRCSSYCSEADGDLICQAGARWEDINNTLKEKGIPLFFPVSALFAMNMIYLH